MIQIHLRYQFVRMGDGDEMVSASIPPIMWNPSWLQTALDSLSDLGKSHW